MRVTIEDIEAAQAEITRLEERYDTHEAENKRWADGVREANGGAMPQTTEMREQVRERFAEQDQLGAELDQARDYLADLQRRFYGSDPRDQRPDPRVDRSGEGTLLVDRIIGSDVYQEALAAGSVRGLLGRQVGIELAGREETRALLAPMSAAGLAPVVGDDMSRLFPPTGIPTQAPRFLDLITVSATDKDVVVYGVQTEENGNVTGAPPGTAFGATTIVTERREESIKRRGTLMDVFEDVLDDEPRMRTWLEPRLRRLVRLNTEAQALFGDGEGQNYTGLTEWDDVGTRQRDFGQSKADAIHQAMTDVRLAYHEEPDAVGFRPETWHDLLTERSGDDGHYVNSGGPFGPVPTSVWGKQAYTSTLLRDGSETDPEDCIVGFHPEAELAVRSGISLQEFEQNKDNAEKGIITLRVQHRSAFVVNQPLAFVLLDLTEDDE